MAPKRDERKQNVNKQVRRYAGAAPAAAAAPAPAAAAAENDEQANENGLLYVGCSRVFMRECCCD